MGESASYERRARLRVCEGPLACETSLLEEVRRLLPPAEPTPPIRPILIVVPSRSLRQHLLARITETLGRALAGIECRTHYGLALDLLRRFDEAAPPMLDLLPVLARRHARDEPALGRALEPLLKGYGALDASLADLIDAGLDPALVDPLSEALTEEGPAVASSAEIERALAMLRVAGRVGSDLERLGIGRASTVLQHATERARADPRRAVVASELLIYGFSDATGVAADFLVALLERLGGLVFLDRPPDPASPGEPDAGVVFTRRFRERLETVARPSRAPSPRGPEAEIAVFRALGARAESREVAHRALNLIEGGARPESIGVVARDLSTYRTPLASQLGRLGVPFSGVGARGPLGRLGRRIHALTELLAKGRAVRVDRWLDAAGAARFGAPVHDLRLALFALGAGRLGEAAELKFERLLQSGSYPLPVRHGFSQPQDDPAAPPRLVRRRLPAAALAELRAAAGAVCHRLDAWRETRRLAAHLEDLRQLLESDLGWGGETVEGLLAVLETAAGRLPASFDLDLEELLDLLEPTLADHGATDLGGLGGGVQLLDVTEARGRTFEHLFVIGLNRGLFPRPIHEDPLLRDALRDVLARQGFGPLPDLPSKLGGYEEESFLFAQLVAASPRVTLSWQQTDEDGVVLTPSPLVERLRWSANAGRPEDWRRPALVALGPAAAEGGWGALATATEHALVTALHGERRELAPVLELALSEAAGSASRLVAPATAVRARLQTLAELDPRRGRREDERVYARLGPFHGLVGPAAGAGDPRSRVPIFITTLERLAVCPWQAFLQRLLRIEAPPDPLAALPAIDGRLIGALVHRVLEAVVEEQLGGGAASLAEASLRSPVPVAWPGERALARILGRESGRLVREDGIGLDGFARVLGDAVKPFLAAARRLDFAEPPAVLAVETRGAFEITNAAGRPRDIFFKADRADRRPEGLSLTDYKTGRRAVSEARTEPARRRHLIKAVRSGSRLQAVAYAVAAGRPRDEGRFLFLHPDLGGDENRVVAVPAGDAEVRAPFEEALRATLDAWDQGVFFPRLVEPAGDSEPATCSYCEVAEACLRGDSGTRARLRARAEASGTGDGGADRAFERLWNLGGPEG